MPYFALLCPFLPCLASACIGTFGSHFGVEKTMDKPLPCLAVSRVTLCRVAFSYWLWLWPLLCPEVVGSKFKMEFLHCTWFVSVPCRVVSCRRKPACQFFRVVPCRLSFCVASGRARHILLVRRDVSCHVGFASRTCRVVSALFFRVCHIRAVLRTFLNVRCLKLCSFGQAFEVQRSHVGTIDCLNV